MRRWRNAEGIAVIKAYSINGMGHGTPIQTNGATSGGQARPFMLDVGISSTWHIAKSWNLIQGEVAIQDVIPYTPGKPRAQENGTQSVGTIIEKAMRVSGRKWGQFTIHPTE